MYWKAVIAASLILEILGTQALIELFNCAKLRALTWYHCFKTSLSY